MPRNQFDDDDDDFEPDGTDLVKQLRKQLKEALKARGDLESELTTMKGQLRSRSLVDTLSEKGVKNASKIAKLVPADVEDVDSWLTEYADVFNIQITQDDGASSEQPVVPESMTQNDLAALRQMDFAAATAVTPSGVYEQQMAQITRPDITEAELRALLGQPGTAQMPEAPLR